MANSKRKCRHCKCYVRVEGALTVGRVIYCNEQCKIDYAMAYIERERAKKARKARAELNKKIKAQKKLNNWKQSRRRKKVKSMAQWYDQLQKLVNQYVLHVRDKDKPCCTCGTTNPAIKYDAGHYRSRGACPELRFELSNIHRQCSVQCNGFKSGARAEYNEFIKAQYGQAHYDWLNGKHPTLKEQFPHWRDIEKEIKRYRKLLRDNDIKPRV